MPKAFPLASPKKEKNSPIQALAASQAKAREE
jgi:hypothetical protein